MRTILARFVVIACMGLAPVAMAAESERVPPITLLTNTQDYDPVRFEAAYMIAEAWRELGLDVEVEALTFPDIIERVQNQQDFDVAILGWSGRVDRLDPQFFLGLADSHQAGLRGNNVTGYANPEYDALFEAQSRAFDPLDRLPYVHAAQAIAAADVPMVILTHRDTVAAYLESGFSNLTVVPSDGLYNEWNLMNAQPLTARSRLRIGGHQRPDSLNPLASTSAWGWRWMRLYYDYLVRLAPSAEPRLWAAESIEIIGEAALEVRLRPGMTFHDGVPVTADDVAFSFAFLRESDFGYFDAYLEPLDSVEVIDPLTLRFNLSHPSASFVTTALSQISILPRHLWEGIEDPTALDAASVPMVGSGPFRFSGHAPDHQMTLERFDEHFAVPAIGITGIEFLFYPDSTAVLSALGEAEIDMTAGTLDPWLIPLAEKAEDVGILAAHDIGFNHVSFNLRRHVFADRGLRRALTHAIDRDRIIDALLDGRAIAGSSLIAPANRFWHNPDVEVLAFDISAAFAELDAAGFGWDEEGKLLMPAR